MSLLTWTISDIAIAAVVCSAILVSLSLIRRRRRTHRVPFPELWQRVLEQRRPRQQFRRRRTLVDLLPYLLAALSALAAVSTLHCPRESQIVPMTLHLVDRSASMAHGRRWAEVQDRLHRELGEWAGIRSEAAVLAVGKDVDLVRPQSGPGPLTPEERDMLRPRPVEADFAQAIATARTMLAGRETTQIRIHSDGALDERSLAAISKCADELGRRCSLDWVGREARPTNTAVTGLAVQRLPHDDARIQVRSQILHDGPEAVDVELIYRGSAGRELVRRPLRLAPGESINDEAEFHRLTDPYIEVELRPAGEAQIELDFDDRAYATVPPAAPRRVLLVSDDHQLFLEAALLSAGPPIELSNVDPKSIESALPQLAAAELVILVAPPPSLFTHARVVELLQSRHLVVFDPPAQAQLDPGTRRQLGLRRSGRVQAPRIDGGERRHPLVEGVYLGHLNVSDSSQLVPGPGDLVLASDSGRPLIVFHPGPPMRLVFGFTPAQSDLPLRVAFPVLIANLLIQSHEFAGFGHRAHRYQQHVELTAEQTRRFAQGRPLELRALRESYQRSRPNQTDGLQLKAHTDLVLRAPGLGAYELAGPARYEASMPNQRLQFAVNMADEQSSSVFSRFTPALAQRFVGHLGQRRRAHDPPYETPTWQWYLCLSAALLALAWRKAAGLGPR